MERSQTFRTLCALALVAGLVAPALAVTVPQGEKHQTLIYRHDGLQFDIAQVAGTEVGEALGGERFAALGVDPATSFVDLRTGPSRWLWPVFTAQVASELKNLKAECGKGAGGSNSSRSGSLCDRFPNLPRCRGSSSSAQSSVSSTFSSSVSSAESSSSSS